jgi:hypothetical protein
MSAALQPLVAPRAQGWPLRTLNSERTGAACFGLSRGAINHEKAERRELAMLFSGSMRYSKDRYKLTAWPAELVKPSYRSNPEWRAKMACWAAFSIT